MNTTITTYFESQPHGALKTLLEEIANHLEFFGYTIEQEERSDTDPRVYYYARHERHSNMRFFEMFSNYVCFQICFWHDGLTMNTAALAEAFNEFNRKSALAKFYFTIDAENNGVYLYTEAIFSAPNAKQSFGLFFDRFKAEERDAFESALFKRCVITKEGQPSSVQ